MTVGDLSQTDRFAAFVRGLSDLGRACGIALDGEMRAYLMERDDYLFDYSIDADGSVALGSLLRDSDGDTGTGPRRDTESCFDAGAAPNIDQKYAWVA